MRDAVDGGSAKLPPPSAGGGEGSAKAVHFHLQLHHASSVRRCFVRCFSSTSSRSCSTGSVHIGHRIHSGRGSSSISSLCCHCIAVKPRLRLQPALALVHHARKLGCVGGLCGGESRIHVMRGIASQVLRVCLLGMQKHFVTCTGNEPARKALCDGVCELKQRVMVMVMVVMMVNDSDGGVLVTTTVW